MPDVVQIPQSERFDGESSGVFADDFLNIAGWSKLSTVDWPGMISATLFLQGCPWRCNYCHNSEILDPHVRGKVSWMEDIMPHLEKRIGLLDGVVFSGGEPLMQARSDTSGRSPLLDAIEHVRGFSDQITGSQAYKIGLHTGGAFPDALKPLLHHLDWVGFDVKAPTGLYDSITNIVGSENNARKSLNLLLEEREFRKNSDRPLKIQFRTTVDPTVIDKDDVKRLKKELGEKGIDDLVLQEVRTHGAPEGYAQKLQAVTKHLR